MIKHDFAKVLYAPQFITYLWILLIKLLPSSHVLDPCVSSAFQFSSGMWCFWFQCVFSLITSTVTLLYNELCLGDTNVVFEYIQLSGGMFKLHHNVAIHLWLIFPCTSSSLSRPSRQCGTDEASQRRQHRHVSVPGLYGYVHVLGALRCVDSAASGQLLVRGTRHPNTRPRPTEGFVHS